jgi:phosphoesterase RecJ-like protein
MEEVVKAIEKAKKILVVGHIMPDGDDISSVLSLSIGLKRLGKEVMSGIDWKIPWIFEDMEEVREIVDYETFKEREFEPDLMVVVDVSSPDRIGGFSELIGKVPVAVVDHHATNDHFANFNWVDKSFGACAQMVLRINKKLGVEYDERLATINLMGILTDTGFLRYPNADIRVYEDATEMVRLGGKPHEISKMILENKRVEQFHLFAEVLEKMKTELDGLLVYSYITQEMYRKHNCTDEDSSGFVHELRSIRGVEVSVMFMEVRPNLVHVSMRSKDWFDLSTFAKSIGGGGHPRAAGATIEGKSVFEVMDYVIPRLREELRKARGETA